MATLRPQEGIQLCSAGREWGAPGERELSQSAAHVLCCCCCCCFLKEGSCWISSSRITHLILESRCSWRARNPTTDGRYSGNKINQNNPCVMQTSEQASWLRSQTPHASVEPQDEDGRRCTRQRCMRHASRLPSGGLEAFPACPAAVLLLSHIEIMAASE